jgi:hypothetical protein
MILVSIADSVWFDAAKLPTLVFAIMAIAIVLYTTFHRKSREKFKVREISGLSAVEDAIGRATEMNRPILYPASDDYRLDEYPQSRSCKNSSIRLPPRFPDA